MAKKTKKVTAKKKKPVKKVVKKVAKKSAPKKDAVKKPKQKIDVRQIFANSPKIHKESGQVRVLVGKAGLDGHDRGAKIIARACRDAGFEVVYTGLHQTPEMIANTAIQEDVDVLGLSILSGAHNYLVPEIIKVLSAQGVKVGVDMLILVGGIIPDSDFATLRKAGVSMVFTPGAPVDSIVEYIRDHVKPKA
jgi:methylmalonyl-CoA mutase C-terminal domain/subunit